MRAPTQALIIRIRSAKWQLGSLIHFAIARLTTWCQLSGSSLLGRRAIVREEARAGGGSRLLRDFLSENRRIGVRHRNAALFHTPSRSTSPRRGNWLVQTERNAWSAASVAQVGLLRELTGARLEQIGQRLDLGDWALQRRLKLHRAPLNDDPAYAERTARIARSAHDVIT